MESSTPVDVDVPPFVVAQALEKIVEREHPDLVLLGKQSIDGDNKQTGSMLSGLLDWPEATNICSMKFQADDPRKVGVMFLWYELGDRGGRGGRRSPNPGGSASRSDHDGSSPEYSSLSKTTGYRESKEEEAGTYPAFIPIARFEEYSVGCSLCG